MNEKIFVTKSLMPTFEEYTAEIKDLWDSCMLTNMGAKHQELQQKLEVLLKVPALELVVNGHMALELALDTLEEKGEIITSPFTFVSTTHAIARRGFTPVFCDVNPVDFTIDVSKIEELITENTVAIMPIHVYGNVCDVKAIEEIAQKHHLKVIYDAAHAFGVEIEGRGIGSFGDFSCFSFHATKVFHTVEGGGICVNHPEDCVKIQALRNFGLVQGEVGMVGCNTKMNEFTAAMGLCNLKYTDYATKHRKIIAEAYRKAFTPLPLTMNPIQEGVKTNYAYFPIFIDPKHCGFSRDDLCEALEAENIVPRKYFYPLTSEMDCYKGTGETPVAKKLSESVLCLPIFPELEMSVVEKVCDIIKGM